MRHLQNSAPGDRSKDRPSPTIEAATRQQGTSSLTTSLTTPAGLQATASLARRRALVLTLNVATWAALLGSLAHILSSGGWTALDILVFFCFAIGSPWTVLGFWNGVIGLVMLHRRKGCLDDVAPFLVATDAAPAISIKTAVLMTLRNEDPARAVLRLQTVKRSLDATGAGGQFSYVVLSDTDRAETGAAEQRAIETWRNSDEDRDRIHYRRRVSNDGFKAGNLREFCARSGQHFELMLPLDADSLMTGPAILRLVRIMQAYPKIGILQSLVVGTPSSSAFARVFQFGMRLGMRTYTMGQSWWVGDCGPYWGHNALLRIKPFMEHCDLPVLAGAPPLGGPILSHDQVEATLMRRAGYEVRVMPVEDGSFEDNPPDVLEFIRRDVRWCQGNMQYLKLLDLPALRPVSRFQLLWAILMFLGVPAWTVMIACLPSLAADAQSITGFPVTAAKVLYVTFLLMFLAPKIAGFADALLTRGEVRRFGGLPRFLSSTLLEIAVSFLQGAISTIRTSIFMVGLPFGKSIVWSGQKRDARGLTWRAAVMALWPQTAFGLAICGALYAVSPAVLLWSLPLTAGYLLAIPFAVVTASPSLGVWMRNRGIAGIPEDFQTPVEIAAVQTVKAA